ncbi:hypothetical protein Cgig2_012380 [Carnegiea gigantea]|uniref:Uncharacterized protein n=1 Tax=Carnegiea gigantea TaxID=171969 RepID=A0A9Q1JI89_9CARY|nr:hypothetical protein Cgig2_012380 [Carnegiea gigantea]
MVRFCRVFGTFIPCCSTFLGCLYIELGVGTLIPHPTPFPFQRSFWLLLMSSNSTTSPLSVSHSEHGDNDRNNSDSPLCAFPKPSGSHPMGGGRGDHPCPPSQKMGPSYAQATKFGVGSSYQPQHSTNPKGVYPSFSSPDHVTDPQLGNLQSPNLRAQESPCFGPPASPPIEHMEELKALCLPGLHEVCALYGSDAYQIDTCPDLPTQSKVEIVVEKFGGAKVTTQVNASNSTSANTPITTADQWIRVSPKKRFCSMVSSYVGKSSPLKPPPSPLVTIVDPIQQRGLSSPTSSPSFLPQVYELASKGPTHEPEPDIPSLAHSIQMLNPDHPTNTDPLNAMDDNPMEDSKDNDYEDS